MIERGRARALIVIPAALAALALALNACGGEGDGMETAREASIEEIPAEPSPLARETLGDELIGLYREIADEEGLDWTVLAAADQVEAGGRGVASGAEVDERATGLALTLSALGAPDDYRQALRGRGGAPLEREVLVLAERYRDLGGARPPSDSGALTMPVDGTVLAGYGRAFGLLHDGLDIDADTGEQVRAAAAGVAVSRGFHPVLGERVCLAHRMQPPLRGERELTTCYGNLSEHSLEVGEAIERGGVVGLAGCTGACLRPHVHFQVRTGTGASSPAVDPAQFVPSEVEIPRQAVPLKAVPSS